MYLQFSTCSKENCPILKCYNGVYYTHYHNFINLCTQTIISKNNRETKCVTYIIDNKTLKFFEKLKKVIYFKCWIFFIDFLDRLLRI